MRYLIPALARRGYPVDLIKVRKHGPNLDAIPSGVRVIDSGVSSTVLALPALVRYLRQHRPAVLLCDKDKVNRIALLARWLSGSRQTRLVLSMGTTISIELKNRGWLDRSIQRFSMGYLYRLADQVIVTCNDVADDMSEYTGLPRERIISVESPVIPAELFEHRPPCPEHPWFADGGPPIILGVGELSVRKNFAMLIRAFATLRQHQPCRLIIVGRGKKLEELKSLAAELGVSEAVDFPGFRSDVYAYMAHASAFAMSSRWEGLGFVLIEAMAAGTPVASARCPSGPREILQDGRLGPLVDVDDAPALAKALAQILAKPLPAEALQQGARPYEIEAATDAYLRAFALPPRFQTETTANPQPPSRSSVHAEDLLGG